MMDKKQLNASLLDAIKNAEKKLSGDDGRQPDLPPGHPALAQIEAAKQRFEVQEKLKTHAKPKKAKKISTDERKAKEDKENAVREKMKNALEFNKAIDTLAVDVEKFAGLFEKTKEIFKTYPMVRNRIYRLERMLIAFHHGLIDTKINSRQVEQSEQA